MFGVAIFIGVLCALISLKKRFYSMWAVLFNILISIYLSIMLTPFLIDLVPEIPSTKAYTYYCAISMAVIFIFVLLILQVMAHYFFTGKVTISFPKMFDGFGSAILGFFAGYIATSFVLFTVSVLPVIDQPLVKKIFQDDTFKWVTVGSVTRACDFVAIVSLHFNNNASEMINHLATCKNKEEKLEIKVTEPPDNIPPSMRATDQPQDSDQLDEFEDSDEFEYIEDDDM